MTFVFCHDCSVAIVNGEPCGDRVAARLATMGWLSVAAIAPEGEPAEHCTGCHCRRPPGAYFERAPVKPAPRLRKRAVRRACV